MRSLVASFTSGRRPAHVPRMSARGDAGRDRCVHRTQHVVDVIARALWIVERALVVGVGGADVGEVAPGDDEERSTILRHGDHRRDVVLRLVPRHRDVDALRRSDRSGMHSLVQCPQLVGPDAGRVHDRLGAHLDLVPVGGDDRADDLAIGVLQKALHRGVVRDRGAVRCRRTRDRERQPRVVGLCVVVQVGRRKPIGRHRRHVGQRLGLAEPLVQLADADAAGEVVHPHRRPECSSDLRVDQPVTREDRDEEREHAYEMGGRLAKTLPLGERLVDEPILLLLQVAQPAVHELGRLRRRAGRVVVALDESGAEPTSGCIEGHADAGDASADHQHVEVLVAETRECRRAIERGERHRRPS